MWEYKDIYMNWGASGYNEYDNVVMADDLVSQLNKYGQEGWELVNLRMIAGTNHGTATFKRRVVDEYGNLEGRIE